MSLYLSIRTSKMRDMTRFIGVLPLAYLRKSVRWRVDKTNSLGAQIMKTIHYFAVGEKDATAVVSASSSGWKWGRPELFAVLSIPVNQVETFLKARTWIGERRAWTILVRTAGAVDGRSTGPRSAWGKARIAMIERAKEYGGAEIDIAGETVIAAALASVERQVLRQAAGMAAKDETPVRQRAM
jgi:hypothetical protein